MHTFLSSSLLAALPFVVTTSYAQEQLINPSDHIRLEHTGLSAPDSMVFRTILQQVNREARSVSGEEFENWLFTEMNTYFDDQEQAWVLNLKVEPKHSRASITVFAQLLRQVAKDSEATRIRTQRELLCPVSGFKNVETRFAALERRDELKNVDDEFFLDYVYENVSDPQELSIREWIARVKPGFKNRQYNYRTLWANRTDELDADLSRFCAETNEPTGDK